MNKLKLSSSLSLLMAFNVANVCADVAMLPWCDAPSVLRFVKDYLPHNPVILEAGSYNGSDALAMSQLWPQGTVHAFEPVPQLFAEVEKKAKTRSNIRCYRYALSDTNGFSEFHLSEAPWAKGMIFASGSLLDPKEHLNYSKVTFPSKISVETITIDTWAQQNNIDNIDLMWLDIQGAELVALKAAPTLLDTVKVIYMEVEFVEAYAGQALYEEIKEWLEERGFMLVAKDFPDPKKKDSEWFGNVIFVKSR